MLWDCTLARQLGVTPTAILKKREALGIPAVPPRRIRKWKEIELLMGKHPDLWIARKFKVAYSSVAGRRAKLGISCVSKQLGVAPRSHELAELIGVLADKTQR